MDRRNLLKLGLALTAGLPFTLTAGTRAWAAEPATAADGSQPFSYDWLKEQALELARQAYQPASDQLPARLRALDWDQYQQIGYRSDRALWHNRDRAFQVQFFHLGLFFLEPVQFYELVDGRARQIGYEPENFEFGDIEDLG